MAPEQSPKRARATRDPKRRPTLGQLVDDYLEKHYACVVAGNEWDRAKRERIGEATALSAFQWHHNVRATAFRALLDARKFTKDTFGIPRKAKRK